VGNKSDMPSQIPEHQMSNLAQTIGLNIYKVSAKTGDGIGEMFEELSSRLIKSGKIRKKVVMQIED